MHYDIIHNVNILNSNLHELSTINMNQVICNYISNYKSFEIIKNIICLWIEEGVSFL